MNKKTRIEAFFMLAVVIVLAVFAAQQAYTDAHSIPSSIAHKYNSSQTSSAIPIQVTGAQWSWTFTYKNGTKSVDKLFLQPNTTYQLVVNSADVIHDLYIGHFGVQVYAVPGQTNTINFTTPSHSGNYFFECVEYCGQGHYEMRGTLTVL